MYHTLPYAKRNKNTASQDWVPLEMVIRNARKTVELASHAWAPCGAPFLVFPGIVPRYHGGSKKGVFLEPITVSRTVFKTG